MAIIFYDDFTRANSATVGNGWTEEDPDCGSINNNKLRMVGNDSYTANLCYADTAYNAKNLKITVEFSMVAIGEAQLWARCSSTNAVTGVSAQVTSSGFKIVRRTGVVAPTTIAAISYAVTTDTTYRLEFWLGDNDVKARLTDVTNSILVGVLSGVQNNFTAAGPHGININTGGTIDYDYYRVETFDEPEIVTDPIYTLAGTLFASQTGITARIIDAAKDELTATVSGLSTDAAGILTVSSYGLFAGDEYDVMIESAGGTGYKRYTAQDG